MSFKQKQVSQKRGYITSVFQAKAIIRKERIFNKYISNNNKISEKRGYITSMFPTKASIRKERIYNKYVPTKAVIRT